jgi:cytoskeletal protein CcmA (bactofilin family)
MPTRHEIVCYECGFVFHQAGRIQAAVCAKCHAKLSFLDVTIKREWEDIIHTAGTVTIAPEGIITGGEIVAGKVVLQGQVKGGMVKAMKSLTLSPGVTYNEKHTQTRDLILQAGAELTLKQPATFRDAEVAGRIEGNLVFQGRLLIHSGGSVYGEIQVQHLAVEEGGGLCAEVKPVDEQKQT